MRLRHATRITTIETSSQTAEALRSIAGGMTFVICAAGIIGTGLLAMPVLAGSAATRWRNLQLARGARSVAVQAKSFYAAISVATMAGVGLNVTRLDPVRALHWSAVVNGVLAVSVVAVVMLIAEDGRIMGRLTIPRTMLAGGWIAASINFFVL